MEGTPWRTLWMLGHLVSLVSCDTSCMLQHRHVGPTGIPCTIHQLDTGELSKTSNTWTSMNPECNHKLWNATQVETLVREQSPDLIWPIWDSLSVEERGDVFRYLVIWHQGGWWADSDVACLKPIADFPVPSNATMIVGYKFGHRWSEKQRQEVNFARTEQFAKYFFAAAPRNPVLLRCLRMVRQRFSWKILQTSDFTGSALFSDAVNEFLESDESLNKEISVRVSPSEGEHLLLSFQSERMYLKQNWNVWILAAGRVNSAPQVSADDPMEAQQPLVLRHAKPQPTMAKS